MARANLCLPSVRAWRVTGQLYTTLKFNWYSSCFTVCWYT